MERWPLFFGRLSARSSTKLPALRRQAAQQRRQVLQVPGNQVADVTATLDVALARPDTTPRPRQRKSFR